MPIVESLRMKHKIEVGSGGTCIKVNKKTFKVETLPMPYKQAIIKNKEILDNL